MAQWRVVWITGASSGIGREVALKLARDGVKVAVSARSADRLNELTTASPNIRAYPLDVVDNAATKTVVARIEADLGPIDLVILNAGTWDAMGAKDFTADRAAHAMAVNYTGIANGVEAIVPLFLSRRAGHLALVSSVAGYRGLPKAAAYGPSKAAVISLAEVLKPELLASGIAVSLINPGFVETPMTAVNKFPMPFLMPVSAAADKIIAGLGKRKFEIAFPWQLVAGLKVLRVLPYPVFFWVAKTFLNPKRKT